MTHPSKEEEEQDTKRLRTIIFSWPFVIAIFTTVLVYSIIDKLILWLRMTIG